MCSYGMCGDGWYVACVVMGMCGDGWYVACVVMGMCGDGWYVACVVMGMCGDGWYMACVVMGMCGLNQWGCQNDLGWLQLDVLILPSDDFIPMRSQQTTA